MLLKPIDHPEHSSWCPPSFPPLPLPINLFFPRFFYFSKFLFLSTEPCDILCIFKRLIRVLLCFYSRGYEYRCRRCCCRSRCCYLRKSFYQKRHFFVTMNTVCATHGAPLCHVCPIITRDRKRRSCANFRGRYITRKLIFSCLRFRFGACKWHIHI